MRRFACAIALAFAVAAAASARAQTITVFAAASLKDALDEAALAYRSATGAETRISYAGSLALARQIEQGAPAEIFISADVESMDYAASRRAIRPLTRFDFLGNRLVVVARADSAIRTLDLSPDSFSRALAGGRLSLGEVATVPVGKYARAALEKLGLWAGVANRVAMSDNARTAMSFVARGEAPLAIVYASDARAEPAVRIVAEIPADAHPPIVYPAALTTQAKPPAGALLDFLRGEARAIFEKHGFLALR